MSQYTLKLYKGRELILESSFKPADYSWGDSIPSAAELIAQESAGLIEEAVECNPPEDV